MQIPSFDYAEILHHENDNLRRNMKIACEQYGLFYLTNVYTLKSERKFQNSFVDFFTKKDKQCLREIKRTQDNSRGYFDDELTKTKLDWKRCFDFGAQDGHLENKGLDGQNQWPKDDIVFKQNMVDYYTEMENVARVLLQLIGKTLNSGDMTQYFDKVHTSFLRLNYYPKGPKDTMAVHEHTDAGALTILYQDQKVTSLQVRTQDGNWVDVPPVENAYVINIGDMMQVWSNDLYKAPLHRVLTNEESERFSAPFFYNPGYNVDVYPLVDSKEKSKYKVVNWGEFRAKRFAGDYANYGEEVQISQYLL